MLVKDFISLYKEDQKAALESISVKTHILFSEKYSLIEQVKNGAIDVESGVTFYDSLTGDFLFDIAVLKFYTDLEFSDESMDELDELKRSGAFDEITELFFYDYLMLEKYYKEKVQTIVNMNNDTQNVLNNEIIKVSNKAIATLDKFATNLDKKMLSKVMTGIKDAVGKFSSTNTDSKPISFNVLSK